VRKADLTILPQYFSRLSRKCGTLNVSQSYGPSRPGTGIILLTFTFIFRFFSTLLLFFSIISLSLSSIFIPYYLIYLVSPLVFCSVYIFSLSPFCPSFLFFCYHASISFCSFLVCGSGYNVAPLH
jgi:hypothetical protein